MQSSFVDEVTRIWSTQFPQSEPIPHRIRDCFSSRWVRFHSLPGSKRYPGNETEMSTILSRHNLLLDELAKPNDVLFVVNLRYSGEPELAPNPSRLNIGSPESFWRSILVDDEQWDLYFVHAQWQLGVLDPLLRAVARNEIAEVMLFTTSGNWIYHPYDGGADIILPSAAERDVLKQRYACWLSTGASGL